VLSYDKFQAPIRDKLFTGHEESHVHTQKAHYRWSMQVSDLVELSAYGKKRFANKYMLDRRGLVIGTGGDGYYWEVHWFDLNFKSYMSRRELKHLKAQKST